MKISVNKLKAGKIIVFWYNNYLYADNIKAVTLAGNCYVDSFISTVKYHNIVDVVESYDEFRLNEEAGKYNK